MRRVRKPPYHSRLCLQDYVRLLQLACLRTLEDKAIGHDLTQKMHLRHSSIRNPHQIYSRFLFLLLLISSIYSLTP